MAIKDYSTTPSSNTALFPEGMNPASVNNSARQVQADIRAFYEAPEWRDLGNTPTYVSGTSFTLSGDVTATYPVGFRIRMYGSVMGTFYGTIATSTYSAPNTTVTVTMDSGALTSNLSAVALGYNTTGSSIPAAAVKGVALLGSDNSFTAKIIYPDKGELTISSGAITVTGTNHTIDTESDASSDDLVTINGGTDGQILFLRPENAARNTVIKESGNIVTGIGDITLDLTSDMASFVYDGALSKWVLQNTFLYQKVLGALPTNIIYGTTAGVVSASGTSVDFTSLPTGIKSFKVPFAGLSTNGTSPVVIQLGDSGGFETSSYLGGTTGGVEGNVNTGDTNSASFYISGSATTNAAATLHGIAIFDLVDESTNTWAISGTCSFSNTGTGYSFGGSKSLSATLDRVRITTAGGTVTFDAGKVNLNYMIYQ